MADVVWISHRGYCEHGATENTEASFVAARALGFLHMETDLHLSLDGEIVIHHDDDLTRLFGSKNRISASTWDQIKGLRTKDAQPLLRLENLFQKFKNIHWTFDVKTATDLRTLEAIHSWASDEGKQNWLKSHVRFLLWSGDADALCKKLFPDCARLARETECYRAGLLSLLGLLSLGNLTPGRVYSVSPEFSGFSLFEKRILNSYHRFGAKLLAYLPPTEELAKKAYHLGFDEILTNGPKYF